MALIAVHGWMRTRPLEDLVERTPWPVRSLALGTMIVTSGKLVEVFDRKYPRERYWDVFAARSAAHVMHFRDIPAMAALSCGDEMHLDQNDQAAFTRALVGALRERHLLREP